MVITGNILFVFEVSGGFDGYGNPIAGTKTESAAIPCNIKTITHDYRLFEDGQQKQARYSVIVDNYRIATLDLSEVKEVKLASIDGNNLGTYQIQLKEQLPYTNKLKVVV